jgi:hypothetical protein
MLVGMMRYVDDVTSNTDTETGACTDTGASAGAGSGHAGRGKALCLYCWDATNTATLADAGSGMHGLPHGGAATEITETQ